MRTYRTCRTPSDFNAGYANNITPDVVERWEHYFRERSVEVLASKSERIELSYGPHPRQRMDFFPSPAARPDAPTLIAIHGGLWFLFDRWIMHFLVPAFAAAGVHVACPSYRLAPENSLGEIVNDCRRAVTCLAAHAPDLGLNIERFSVLGHSAAGQLAAIVAGTDWTMFDSRSGLKRMNAWVGVSGFYEIEPFAQTDFQPLVGFAEDEYQRWNPIASVTPHLPPSLLITGERESGWLHEMTSVYERALQLAGVSASVIDAPTECHFSVLSAIGRSDSDLHRRVLSHVTATQP
jgi:arylformamidase